MVTNGILLRRKNVLSRKQFASVGTCTTGMAYNYRPTKSQKQHPKQCLFGIVQWHAGEIFRQRTGSNIFVVDCLWATFGTTRQEKLPKQHLLFCCRGGACCRIGGETNFWSMDLFCHHRHHHNFGCDEKDARLYQIFVATRRRFRCLNSMRSNRNATEKLVCFSVALHTSIHIIP